MIYLYLCSNELELNIEVHQKQGSKSYEVVRLDSGNILLKSRYSIYKQLFILAELLHKTIQETSYIIFNEWNK